MEIEKKTQLREINTYRIEIPEGEPIRRVVSYLNDLPEDAVADYGYTLEFSLEKPVTTTPSDNLVQEIVKICKIANNKVCAIKMVRDISRDSGEDGMGLLEAKNLVERFW